MTKSILLVTTLAAYLQSLHAQSIFYGNSFICDQSQSNLDCKPGDNIICDANKQCSIQCSDGCAGIIINAKKAISLSITNCIDCDQMTVYCPQNGAYNTDNICTLSLSNNVHDVTIYAQESFNDFQAIQAPNTPHSILTSSIHCGDLSMIEFQCVLSADGNSCTDPLSTCQSYRIPTVAPTPTPTSVTKAPTTRPIISAVLSTSNTAPTTQEREHIDSTHINEEIDLFAETHSNNAHYIMLIVGLCIIWGSFFCCFIIMYYHREKKQQLNKTVNIMSRPMSPSYHPSKSQQVKSPTKSKAHQQGHNNQETSMDSPPKKLQLKPFSSKTHTEANELYKEKTVSNLIQLNLSGHAPKKKPCTDHDEKEEKSKQHMIVDIIHSPKYGLSPRMDFIRSPRLTPRPYFYDKHSGSITPYMSNRSGKLFLHEATSNAMSINTVNTAEAVEIKLPVEVKLIPCYDVKVEEEEAAPKQTKAAIVKPQPRTEQILQKHETPQFEEDINIRLDVVQQGDEDEDEDGYEGSLDSKYKVKIEEKHDSSDSDDDVQTEGDDKSVMDGVQENKMRVFWEYSEAPPPPPPSLVNNENHSYMNSVNSISNIQAQMSPSRHYRVKYSLGIQQDIKNCMSAPGAVAEKKKFAFDDKAVARQSTESSVRRSHKKEMSNSYSPRGNFLLKPPVSPSYQSHHNRYYVPGPPVYGSYYQGSVGSVTPQPVSQVTYLAFPQSRPRIYSDPTFPAKQSL